MEELSFKDIFKNITKKPEREVNDNVLVIDSMNLFIRNFVTLQSLNPQGHHTGGLIGFLRSLNHLVRFFDPTRVICVFDGIGSTINRKSINPNYKAQRGDKRISTWNMFDDKEDEFRSMNFQIQRLVDYLECLPVTVVNIDKVEADDVISYIVRKFSEQGKKSTIVSTDKDFLQLVNENIEVYSPIKKKGYSPVNVIEEFGVLPKNYLLVKALLGDKSDNLEGVKGLGEKTVLSEFPQIVDTVNYSLEDIFQICEANMEGKKIYSKILNQWSKVETNFELMDLFNPKMGEREINLVEEKLLETVPTLSKYSFTKLLEMDQIESLNKNVDQWLDNFRTLQNFKNK